MRSCDYIVRSFAAARALHAAHQHYPTYALVAHPLSARSYFTKRCLFTLNVATAAHKLRMRLRSLSPLWSLILFS